MVERPHPHSTPPCLPPSPSLPCSLRPHPFCHLPLPAPVDLPAPHSPAPSPVCGPAASPPPTPPVVMCLCPPSVVSQKSSYTQSALPLSLHLFHLTPLSSAPHPAPQLCLPYPQASCPHLLSCDAAAVPGRHSAGAHGRQRQGPGALEAPAQRHPPAEQRSMEPIEVGWLRTLQICAARAGRSRGSKAVLLLGAEA